MKYIRDANLIPKKKKKARATLNAPIGLEAMEKPKTMRVIVLEGNMSEILQTLKGM
jgi:hypothetical protein